MEIQTESAADYISNVSGQRTPEKEVLNCFIASTKEATFLTFPPPCKHIPCQNTFLSINYKKVLILSGILIFHMNL